MRTFLRALYHHCAVSSDKSLKPGYICWNCKNYRRALIQTNISLYATLSSSPHKNLSITFDGFSSPSRNLWNFFFKNLWRWIFTFSHFSAYSAQLWDTVQQKLSQSADSDEYFSELFTSQKIFQLHLMDFLQPSRNPWNFFFKNLWRWIFCFRISRFYFAQLWPTSQQESYFPVYPKNFCLTRLPNRGIYQFPPRRPLPKKDPLAQE